MKLAYEMAIDDYESQEQEKVQCVECEKMVPIEKIVKIKWQGNETYHCHKCFEGWVF